MKLENVKVGFIGLGNMSQAMIQAVIENKTMTAKQIWASNRSSGKLKRFAERYPINTVVNNEEVVDACDWIVLAVKPQQLQEAIEPIARAVEEHQTIFSMAAGIPIKSLQKYFPLTKRFVRFMPNTPIQIQEAVIGYAMSTEARGAGDLIQEFLETFGYTVALEEGEAFEALTVGCGSGPGFVFELMDYWQDWLEEHGFEGAVAQKMVIQTFLGAALLAKNSDQVSLTELQNKVVSKKGVTAAGLDSMRELEIERALRYSFEKAVLRDRELSRY